MSFRRSIEQLRPARTPKVAIVEQAQNYLRELTISPHYQQKGNFNPYYTLDVSIEKIVKEDYIDYATAKNSMEFHGL